MSVRGVRTANDARLVAMVRDGHSAGFEAIYDRYHAQIFGFCRHLLGDSEEAADATQHTFLAAYSAITSSRKSILLRAWLFTIARNRCYSILRARRQQAVGEIPEAISEGLATEVLRREDLRQLLRDLRRLPQEQRSALVLAELGMLTHQAVAGALGVSPSKVKALVFQARESLTAMREARETDCSVIRDQLATLRGASLRRGSIRRHLRDCAGCREFSERMAPRPRGMKLVADSPG